MTVRSVRRLAPALAVLALLGGACATKGSVDDAIAAAGSSTTTIAGSNDLAPDPAGGTSPACLLTDQEVSRATGIDVATSQSDAERTTTGVWMCDYLDDRGRLVLSTYWTRPTPDGVETTRSNIADLGPERISELDAEAYWLTHSAAVYVFGSDALLRVQSKRYTFQPGMVTPESIDADRASTVALTKAAYGRIPPA